MSGFWRLAVRSEFSAAHALRHYKGKCEHLHGHNFGVELVVEGSDLTPDTGLLIDFSVLKLLLRQALRSLDHCILNEVPPFDDINPSSELLAKYIAEEVARSMAACPEAQGVHVHSVSVSEKSSQTAQYFPHVG